MWIMSFLLFIYWMHISKFYVLYFGCLVRWRYGGSYNCVCFERGRAVPKQRHHLELGCDWLAGLACFILIGGRPPRLWLLIQSNQFRSKVKPTKYVCLTKHRHTPSVSCKECVKWGCHFFGCKLSTGASCVNMIVCDLDGSYVMVPSAASTGFVSKGKCACAIWIDFK